MDVARDLSRRNAVQFSVLENQVVLCLVDKIVGQTDVFGVDEARAVLDRGRRAQLVHSARPLLELDSLSASSQIEKGRCQEKD